MTALGANRLAAICIYISIAIAFIHNLFVIFTHTEITVNWDGILTQLALLGVVLFDQLKRSYQSLLADLVIIALLPIAYEWVGIILSIEHDSLLEFCLWLISALLLEVAGLFRLIALFIRKPKT